MCALRCRLRGWHCWALVCPYQSAGHQVPRLSGWQGERGGGLQGGRTGGEAKEGGEVPGEESRGEEGACPQARGLAGPAQEAGLDLRVVLRVGNFDAQRQTGIRRMGRKKK